MKDIILMDNSNLDKRELLFDAEHLNRRIGVIVLASNIKEHYAYKQELSSTTQGISNLELNQIVDKKLYETVKKRKNWTAPGIYGIQIFLWKKLTGTWKAITDCFKKWMEQPEEIGPYMANPRANSAIPKTEDVNKKNYRPITCLNTVYKIFTGMIGSYMKNHADRNNIWDKSQLGTCSGVLGTVDQLVIDNAIMDEVREKLKNLAVAFYEYQKAYDMVRHDWMLRVYRWMGVLKK